MEIGCGSATRLIMHAWAYPESIALGIVVLLITYLSLTLGELAPKRIAMSKFSEARGLR